MRGLLKILVSATVGLAYGLLFAQKSGKKFRTELSHSKNKGETLINELQKIDQEARGSIAEWARNSEDLQNVLATGKEQFDVFVEKVKDLGEDVAEVAEQELETMAKNAKTAADQLKKKATKEGKKVIKKVQKKSATVKKKAVKKTKKVVKKVTKKVAKKK
jgi:gas vesicle protein